MSAIVADSSALLSILLAEADAEFFATAIQDASEALLSVASLLEVSIVVTGRNSKQGREDLKEFLTESRLTYVPLSIEIGFSAAEAFQRFGKGVHPAGLNFGDCFTYATATHMNMPLLCKGLDFIKTDLTCIVPQSA